MIFLKIERTWLNFYFLPGIAYGLLVDAMSEGFDRMISRIGGVAAWLHSF